MKTEIIQELILFVDSAKASFRTSHDNFEVELPSRSMVCNENEYIELEVTECTFRRDFYSVQSYNKNYTIIKDGVSTSKSLTEGFPTAVTIDQELKTAFEAVFAAEAPTITVSWSSYTGKITITMIFAVAYSPGSDPILDTDVTQSAFEIIGFSKKQHTFTASAGNTIYTLVGDQAVNVLGEQDVYLRSSLCNTNFENAVDGIEQTEIVAKFPILSAPFSNLTFFNTGRLFRSKIAQRNLGNFSVRLTNENNVLVGLQTNCTMTLTFRRLREVKDETARLLNDLLRLERVKLVKKSL